MDSSVWARRIFSCGMWESSSLTRDQTQAPALGAQTLSHQTIREVPRVPIRIPILQIRKLRHREVKQLA